MSKSRIKRLSAQITDIDSAISHIDQLEHQNEHLTAENEGLRSALKVMGIDPDRLATYRQEQLLSELYQICGSLLADAGAFDSEEGQMLMDELHTPTGQSLLPWPAFRDDHGVLLDIPDDPEDQLPEPIL